MDRTSEARRKGYETGYGYEPHDFADALREGRLEHQEGTSDHDIYCGVVVDTFHEHTMQYSPWEFYAKEYNESDDPDATWECFDAGLMAGARRKWREVSDSERGGDATAD